MAYNSRRGILGALPIREKINCHLLNIGYSKLKSHCDVKLIKKLKWNLESSPNGRSNCLISVLFTNPFIIFLHIPVKETILRASISILLEREWQLQPSLADA